MQTRIGFLTVVDTAMHVEVALLVRFVVAFVAVETKSLFDG